jgi:hypothetical protein
VTTPDLRGRIATTLDEQIAMIERKRDKAQRRFEQAQASGKGIDSHNAHASLCSYRNILESMEELKARRAE